MAKTSQRRKITHVFTEMDTDGDGCLAEFGWWATLLAASDSEQVTVAEILSVVDRLGDTQATAVAPADSRDECATHWAESWPGDDPDAHDSWAFGRSA